MRRLQGRSSNGFDYAHPEEIWEEMRSLTPDFAGITWERLEREGGVHWPCPSLDHPGTPYLFEHDFPRGKGKFWALEYGTESELPDADYPLNLTTGRVLFHWHGGTMTRRSRLEDAYPEPLIEMHPEDAQRLTLVSGDWAEVTSRRGSVICRVLVTGRSPVGTVFLPFHFVEAAANLLTLDKIDPRAKIPDFKMAAVRIRACAAPEGSRRHRCTAGGARRHPRADQVCALGARPASFRNLPPGAFTRYAVDRRRPVMSRLIRTHLPEDRIREYCARQPIRRLSVFGSAARNELTLESDIDLLVEYMPDAAISLFDMGGHLTDLSEIVGRRVDLCTPNGLSPYIRDEIIESAKLIYAKES